MPVPLPECCEHGERFLWSNVDEAGGEPLCAGGEGLTHGHPLEVHLSVTIVVDQCPEYQLRVFCILKG